MNWEESYSEEAITDYSSPEILHDVDRKTETIPFNDIRVNHKKLGEGSFSQVFRGLRNDEIVALKTLKATSARSAVLQRLFKRKCTMMFDFSHVTNLVEVFGVTYDHSTRSLFMVAEYLRNGNLLEYLQNAKYLKLKELLNFAGQVANGMSYLEVRNIPHGDLTIRNILIGASRTLKITGFGLAGPMQIYFCKDKKQISAENLQKRLCYIIKHDVWSYGELLLEIFYCNNRHSSSNSSNNVKQRTKLLNDIDQKMLECWDPQPDVRPSFETLFRYFRDYQMKISE